jgi:hypothetical protein
MDKSLPSNRRPRTVATPRLSPFTPERKKGGDDDDNDEEEEGRKI